MKKLVESIVRDLLPEDWWTDMSGDAQKQYLKDYPNSPKSIELSNPSGKKEKGENVVKTKPYSREQAQDETGEYFENDVASQAMPNLAKDENDLTQKILDAPEETLSDDDLRKLNNSDAGDVLDSKNPMKHAKKMAIEYDKSWDYITKNIKSGEAQESPIAVRDKNGEMWLLAGNTRLMAQTGHGNKIPVKVINYDGEIKQPTESIKEITEVKKIKKIVGIYGGRYQPFGPHHFKTYKWLKSKVDDAYITTTNIKKPPRHPMNFKEKVRHMVKMGVPKNRIIEEKIPYVAKNVLKKYDSETTAVIYIFGAKDAGRLAGGKKKDGSPSYYQEFKKNKNNLKGYEEHGYILTAPHVSIRVGGKEVSGTVMRDLLGSPKIKDEERPKLFKDAFGYFDKGVFTMMTNKFRKLYEYYETFLKQTDINKVILESSNVSAPNLADEGLYDFFEDFEDYKRISPRWAEKHGYEIVNFILGDGAVDPTFDYTFEYQRVPSVTYGRTVNQNGKNWQSVDEPFKKYAKRQKEINDALGWELIKFMMNPKDGIDIKDTWKVEEEDITKSKKLSDINKDKDDRLHEGKEMLNEGKLIAARNKGHLKNKGKTALDVNGMKSKFEGRGDIADAFIFAMKDMESAIGKLSDKQRDKVFMNGSSFMNLEVMWPKSANVIDYDKAEIVFHGALEYDDDGNVVGQVSDSGRMLAGMIKQVNQNIQRHYKIGKPNFLTVPKHQDFGKMKKKYFTRLQKLQKEFNLKDNDSLSLYHQKWWERFILQNAKKFKVKLKPTQLKNLTMRWAFFNKKYTVPMIRKDYEKYPKFKEWVLGYDKNNHQKQMKQNMKPFEVLFFDVGSEIMKNVSGWLAASPDKAVQGIKKRLDKSISSVRSGGDLKKLNTLKIQMDRLNAIGGLKAIVPSEGIVFKYKGNTYKFTGAFAPINQITGLLAF
jgi:hypothetical protein|tara:strand:+ start:870 stop:3668 length:2799 start_codon:yes stop_codon:yes gene_type:complete